MSWASSPPAPARGRRLADHLTVAMLLATLAVVAIAAGPSAAGQWLLEQPVAARRGIARSLWQRGWAMPPADAPSEAPRPTELEELFPELLHPRLPSADSNVQRLSFATHPLKLREEPTPSAAIVGEVSAGDSVIVLRENEGWLLVIPARAADSVVFGWVPESHVGVLP